MLGLLDQEKIGRFGGGYHLREAHQPLIIEKKDLKIALLGYSEFLPRSLEANTNTAGVAGAVIGVHPHVRQDIEHYRGKPIFYSIRNFMMDALDNEEQTKGWGIRLQINRQGVLAYNAVVANITPEGTPIPNTDIAAPCWFKNKTQQEKVNNAPLDERQLLCNGAR